MNNIIEQMKAAAEQVRGDNWGNVTLSVAKYSAESAHRVEFNVMTQAANFTANTLEEALAGHKEAISPERLLNRAAALEAEARKLRELSATQAACASICSTGATTRDAGRSGSSTRSAGRNVNKPPLI